MNSTIVHCTCTSYLRTARDQKTSIFQTRERRPEPESGEAIKLKQRHHLWAQGGHVRRFAGRRVPARAARGRSRPVNTGHNLGSGARLEARNSSMSLRLWNLAH